MSVEGCHFHQNRGHLCATCFVPSPSHRPVPKGREGGLGRGGGWGAVVGGKLQAGAHAILAWGYYGSLG